MRDVILLAAIAGLLSCSPVQARVVDQAASGFVIEIRADVAQTASVAYQQFLNVQEWWDANHSWFGSAENFHLEASVGGCFCEIDGDRQVQHMTVVYVEPGKEIRMLGGLGPLQMMAVHGAMSWTFNEADSGVTSIVHRYSVTGYHKDGLDKLAGVVDQVQNGQVERLVTRLKEIPPHASPAKPSG